MTSATQTVLNNRMTASVNGVPTEMLGFDTHHSVDRQATGSVSLPLPVPEHLRGGDGAILNRTAEIKSGFVENEILTVFNGRINADTWMYNEIDQTATFRIHGWSKVLAWPEERDLVFSGPIALHDIIRSLCRWRGVPMYRVDNITSVTGETIMLGTNPNIDDGNVTIPRRTSPQRWIERKCELFGYRAFDTPSGEFRVQRITGEPNTAPVAVFKQGVNAYRWERSRDLEPMATYIRIDGPTYTDDDGIQIPIISFPASVPGNQLLAPPGYRAHRESDNDLVTNELADYARAAQEINRAAPYRVVTWESFGHSHVQPGDVVSLDAPGVDAFGRYWVMRVDHRHDAMYGYHTTFSAWAGTGDVLPSGDDLEIIDVRQAPLHLGDEYVAWYAMPAPETRSFTTSITIPEEYTSIAISLYAHGVNSHMAAGTNTDSTVSKIEVWQNGEEVGSAELPILPEDYGLRLPYGAGLQHWTRVRMPIPGRVEAGSAEVKIISGEHSQLPWSIRFDDFEIRNVQMELRGMVFPDLPNLGVM